MGKLKMRILSIVLGMVMVLSMLPVVPITASAADAQEINGITLEQPEGDGTEANPYQLGTAGELYWFMAAVNGTLLDADSNTIAADADAWAELTADIVVNEDVLADDGTLNSGSFIEWVPIAASNYYSGTFNGNGHTISGLYLDKYATSSSSGQSKVGLFGSLKSPGKIMNVGVEDSYLAGYEHVGGICGYLMTGTLEKCYNAGTVKGYQKVGGLCAGSNNGNVVITGCYNSGNVTGTNTVGGLLGYIQYTSASASSTLPKVSDCYNKGTVNGPSINTSAQVGGLIAVACSIIMENCYNSGDVIVDTPSSYNRNFYVAGVVGYLQTNYKGECYNAVKNCYNTGDISITTLGTSTSSSSYVGGVFGYYYNTVASPNCYNTGNITITNSKLTSKYSYIGGVAGYVFNSSKATTTKGISNCYNTGDITTGSTSALAYVGGVVGYDRKGTSSSYSSGKLDVNLSGAVTGGIFGGVDVAPSNCYYDNTVYTGDPAGDDPNGVISTEVTYGKSTEEFKSGEVAYLLNNSTSEGTTEAPLVWYQSLDNGRTPDAAPILVSTGDNTVYYLENANKTAIRMGQNQKIP